MYRGHRFFVIAKINGQYRSLATIYHQGLYGIWVLYWCDIIFQIFSAPPNRIGLRHDITHAGTLEDTVWKAEIDYTNHITHCPYIVTCLLGDPTRGYSSVSVEPFNRHLKRNNEDSITIFDVSDLERVRYCFVSGGKKRMTPLTADEYLREYLRKYKEESDTWDDAEEVRSSFYARPLVRTEALNEAWPDDRWHDRKQAAPHSEPCRPGQTQTSSKMGAKSFRQTSMGRFIGEALQGHAPETGLSEAELLDDFRTVLLQTLSTNPREILESPTGVTLLQRTLRGEEEIDLSPFASMPERNMLEVLFYPMISNKMCSLDLSGCAITPEGLKAVLLNNRSLKKLTLMHTRNINLRGALSAINGSAVTEISHSEHFNQAFVRKPDMTSGEFPAGTGTAYPVVQMICLSGTRGSDTKDEHSTSYSMEWATDSVLPLRDGLIPIARLVYGLPQLLEPILRMDRNEVTAGDVYLTGAKAFAMCSGIEYKIYPLPAELYMKSRYHWHTPAPKAAPLQAGEWTIVILQEISTKNSKYAFITPKSGTYDFDPSIRCHGDVNDEIIVADFSTFLEHISSMSVEEMSKLKAYWNTEMNTLIDSLCGREKIGEVLKAMCIPSRGSEKRRNSSAGGIS